MSTSERDPEAVARFIERFGSNLTDAGIPRLPARAFVALLASDSGRMTAAELAGQLLVSPAAISGAVRYLTQVNLVSREREPGSRRDVYRVFDDAWYEAALRREPMLRTWEQSLREGIQVLSPDTPAAHRLAESLKFIEFLESELPALFARWAARKAAHRADPPPEVDHEDSARFERSNRAESS